MLLNRLLGGTAVALGLTLAACGGAATNGGGTATPTATASAALIHTASIKVGDRTETVLKNQQGLTLYYFMLDSATTVACSGGCASLWPPLIAASGSPTSDPALPGALTVVNGANGNQVAYNGHPLYHYSKDGAPADANGQGIGGKWFVATPDLPAGAGQPSSNGYNKPTY